MTGRALPDRPRGHELVPHTADLTVHAWAPTVEECLAEAVSGLAESFADRAGGPDGSTVPVACPPAADSELLVQVLEEMIFLVDARDVVPYRARLQRAPDGGLTGYFTVVDRRAVRPVGPAPKAVTRHGLFVGRQGGTWRCTVTIDV